MKEKALRRLLHTHLSHLFALSAKPSACVFVPYNTHWGLLPHWHAHPQPAERVMTKSYVREQTMLGRTGRTVTDQSEFERMRLSHTCTDSENGDVYNTGQVYQN